MQAPSGIGRNTKRMPRTCSLGQTGTRTGRTRFKAPASPVRVGKPKRTGTRYSAAIVAGSILTPGPIVELSEIFFTY